MSRCFLTILLAVSLTPVWGEESVYSLLKNVTGLNDDDFNVLSETIRIYGAPKVDILRKRHPDVARKIEAFNRQYDSLSFIGKRFIDKMFAYAVRERLYGESSSTMWKRLKYHFSRLDRRQCGLLIAKFSALRELEIPKAISAFPQNALDKDELKEVAENFNEVAVNLFCTVKCTASYTAHVRKIKNGTTVADMKKVFKVFHGDIQKSVAKCFES
ncbi:hypothetical protein Aduo_008223 [Ancylostoma duodenale]